MENYPSNLNIRIAEQTIVDSQICDALWLVIVRPVGRGPGLGSQASECAVPVVEDVPPGVLIPDLCSHCVGVKVETGEGDGTSS